MATAVSPTPLAPTALDVYVARQPIFDMGNRRIAYELLYRDGPLTTKAGLQPVDVMCSEMALHALLTIGLDQLTGGATAWINITREHLLAGLHRLFDPKNIVLELLESISADAEVLAACADARKDGYVLALDDYDGRAELDALLNVVQIVKVQVMHSSEGELTPVVRALKAKGLVVLAECVETTDQHEMCKKIGFTLFQGYVFSRPETLAGRAMSIEQITILKILGLLNNETVSEAKLEEAFQSHPTLSYALLRIVNSAAIGFREVASIPHAMRIIGRGAMSRWLHVMLVATVASRSPIAHEAVQQALVRARFCELMTLASGKGDPSARFMVGLISRLDVLLGIPLKQVLERLPVMPDVQKALLEGTGSHARALTIAIAYESANWDDVSDQTEHFAGELRVLTQAYAESLAWAHERLSAVNRKN
ncbi:MAG: EAL domain-containing protein [Gemmatimonadaceae bacterium]